MEGVGKGSVLEGVGSRFWKGSVLTIDNVPPDHRCTWLSRFVARTGFYEFIIR